MKEHADNNNTIDCVVVGAVNIDICAKPHQALIAGDSNPGRFYTTIGAMGRNIAHSLTLLGISVKHELDMGGGSLAANIELVFNNARLAARIACEMA